MKHIISKTLSTIVILISSTLYASPNSAHRFPITEASKNNFEDKVKPYEWYEQRSQKMIERTRQSEIRFNQIKRDHDWHR
jgi:hypothetical protein